MKKPSIILLTGILFACSSSNKYEKAIADFVQTDKKGTFYDMKFKALEIKELQRITVADSIVLLNEQTETERNKKIADAKRPLEMYEAVLPTKSEVNQKYYNNLKATTEQEIDEIKKWNPNYTAIYDNRPKDELLAIVVQCKYSLVPPTLNTTITETKNFILSPDGKRCLRKSKVE